jgi:hypothetical protein
LALVIMDIVCIGLCYKWGDWRNWKRYYSTMLFYIIGSLTENIITCEKPLWLFHGSYPIDRLADYFFGFLIFPCIIILFLSNYPKGRIRQITYLFAFIFVMSFVEYILYSSNEIEYYNGWNIGWSVLLYVGVFPLLRLHYKKPLWAMLLLFILVCGGMFYFKISLNNLK